MAIIDQGNPKPRTQNPPVAVDSVKVQAIAPAKPPVEAERPAKAKSEKGREPENPAIVTVTFRLPSTIPPALLKASSEQKLKKITPFTQQDIVAEALKNWLEKNGY